MSDAQQLTARIQNYLECGGLFNPECMEHEKVRDLILALQPVVAERDAEKARANGADIELTKLRHELRQAWTDYDTASKDASKAWGMCHAARSERDAVVASMLRRARSALRANEDAASASRAVRELLDDIDAHLSSEPRKKVGK